MLVLICWGFTAHVVAFLENPQEFRLLFNLLVLRIATMNAVTLLFALGFLSRGTDNLPLRVGMPQRGNFFRFDCRSALRTLFHL